MMWCWCKLKTAKLFWWKPHPKRIASSPVLPRWMGRRGTIPHSPVLTYSYGMIGKQRVMNCRSNDERQSAPANRCRAQRNMRCHEAQVEEEVSDCDQL